MIRSAIACLVLFIAASPAAASANWPHWRGPHANGAAPNADPPITWDGPSGKNIRWKAPLVGRGSATPIIWGEQVFVVSAEKTDREAKPDELPKPRPGVERMTTPPRHFYRFIVTSYNRATGKVLWQKVATEAVPHEGHHETHSYAAGSPTTDGERLYVSFGSFGIFSFDLHGKLLWERQLGRLTTRRGWGEAVTPVIHRGRLLLNWDQEVEAALYCLDAQSGKTIWKADRDEVTTWTTPFVTDFGGKTQVILNGTTRVRSHDLETGQMIWSCGGMTVNAIPSVLRHADAAIVMSGYQGSRALSIPLSSQGNLGSEGPVNWRYQAGTPYVPSPVLVGDQLYFTGKNGNLLTVLDAATGKPILAGERLPGTQQFYASPIFAGGCIYFTDRDGVTLILKPGPQLEVLATNKLDDPVDASPVAVGKQLFLRGEKFLYCIEAGEPAPRDAGHDRFRILPTGWTVTESVVVPPQQLPAFSRKLGAEVVRISNTTLSVDGQQLKVNIIEGKTDADAAKLHESLLRANKGNHTACPRDGKSVVEFFCKDVKLIERGYQELGFKPPRVTYEVSFHAAPIEKCDYMQWNKMFNVCLAPTPNEALIRDLSKSFTFGEQIRLRNHGLGGEKSAFTFTPRPRSSMLEAEGDVTTYTFADLPRRHGLPDVGVVLTVTAEAFALTPSKRKTGPELLAPNEFWPSTDPEIVALARQITAGKTSARDKANAVLDWLMPGKHIRYSAQVPGFRYGVKKVLRQGFGLCWDFSDCFVTLCRAAGVPSRQVMGWLHGVSGHVWAEVLIEGEGWRQVDPTAGMGCDCRYLAYIANEDGRVPIVYTSAVDIRVKR